jgi:aminopeptidase
MISVYEIVYLLLKTKGRENSMKSADASLLRNFERTSYAAQAQHAARNLKTVFKHALPVQDEKLLIVSDTGTSSNKTATMLSYAYHTAAEDAGLKSELILQSPRDRVTQISPLVLRKLKSLPSRSSLMQCVSNRLGTLDGLGKSFRKFCKANDHRFTSASSLGNLHPRHFSTLINAHNYDYRHMKKKQESLKKKLDVAEEVHVTTPAGTDIFLGIENARAVFNHGIYDTFGHGGNLPAGEIYIPVNRRNAYGKLVVDASSRQKDKTVLCKEPITMYFDNGVARKITGGSEAQGLIKTYDWATKRAKYPWGIKMAAELGIGLNEKSKIVGATILDEKVKGTAHIATGSNHWFGGDIKAILHVDQVFNNPTIKLDGKTLHI